MLIPGINRRRRHLIRNFRSFHGHSCRLVPKIHPIYHIMLGSGSNRRRTAMAWCGIRTVITQIPRRDALLRGAKSVSGLSGLRS